MATKEAERREIRLNQLLILIVAPQRCRGRCRGKNEAAESKGFKASKTNADKLPCQKSDDAAYVTADTGGPWWKCTAAFCSVPTIRWQ